MAAVITIAQIAQYVGQEVTLRGWVYDRTETKKVHFVMVRDGSGLVQGVGFKPDLNDDLNATIAGLTQESAIVVTGTVQANPKAEKSIPQGYELAITGLEVVQMAVDYPITPKDHGIEFLLDNRHLWLRSRRQWAVIRIRATIVHALRNWLDERGFLLVDTPIITPTAGENTTNLFEIDYFGEPAYLAQTGQLYNEANMMAFGKVYCFGPTFRAEKSKTRRHLMEFWMLEPEIAYCSLEDLMSIEESMIAHVVEQVIAKHPAELAILERDIARLEAIKAPFARISYDDAVQRVQAAYEAETDPERKAFLKIEWGEDFGSAHETAIAEMFDRPVFVYHYPTAVKAFYMQPVEGRPEVCRSVDLLAPEGYGEITGGSERIYDLALMDERVKNFGIDPNAYAWYLDLRKYGSVPHAGFGLGLERAVAWICGLDHLREGVPYARLLNRKYP
ncbi:MAG: asparagine--tRNA ligase [bacterium]|nr:asparagine--tRNA ligase [bacterium]